MTVLISRRLALFRIIATAAVAGAAAVPAAVVAMQPKNPESRELLRLGRHLDRLTSIMRTRASIMTKARAACLAIWPEIPTDLVISNYNKRLCDGSEQERDCDGKVHWYADDKPPRRYFSSYIVRGELEMYLPALPDDDQETIEQRDMLGRLLALAEGYERELEAAPRSSGYLKARSDHNYAGFAVQKCALQIAKIPSQTPDGITIKAKAYEAVAEFDSLNQTWAANQIAPSLAADICRILSDEEAA